MKTSAGEDILEAACLLLEKEKSIPTVRKVAGRLSEDEDRVRKEALELEKGGFLRLEEGDIIELSEKGREAGLRTIQKHTVLERFLSEILGMERAAASEEACILEHDISDETADRLEGFIAVPRGRGRRLQRGRRRLLTLADVPEGTDLRVVTVRCRGGYERLADLGILPGETIRVVHILNHKAVVVRVKGCDVALSPEIASSILVERLQ
ncbi:MAG: metal-dependent transcriptional regulator [Methanolinea sp.]|jgi:DtxR family Mn-dependent transcriptional regulator|nr:metal-dependent transcriptional regulator [Methanolinea sp.]MDI6899550.1 metal-dependent transcriptional regulator [Methanolinea sp.]